MSGVASLEVRISDGSGTMTVVFMGRRHIAGMKTGARLIVEGVVGQHGGRLAMLNPYYELLAEPEHDLPPAGH
jgi:RecG-like helicase